MLIVEVSSVTRMNSSVVALATRPRTSEPGGRSRLLFRLNIKNALVVSTALIATVVVPLQVLVAVPFWIVFASAARQLLAETLLLPTEALTVKTASTGEVRVAKSAAASSRARTARTGGRPLRGQSASIDLASSAESRHGLVGPSGPRCSRSARTAQARRGTRRLRSSEGRPGMTVLRLPAGRGSWCDRRVGGLVEKTLGTA